ncbi:MAG: 30S ribosomal protein S15 [Armatimonadetes bacterium]|nr:30S ribosomal protein S15 [Armatimonadota bacterium]
MLDSAEKTAIISRFQRDEHDTGSPEVQIALLTTRIKQLTEHLIALPKDFHSRRGLYKMVSSRKRLLAYVARTEPATHRRLLSELGIRG